MNSEQVDTMLGLLAKIVTQNSEALQQHGELLAQNARFIEFIEKRDAALGEFTQVHLENEKLSLEQNKFRHAQFMLELEAMQTLNYDMREADEHGVKLALGKMESDKKYSYPKAMQVDGELPGKR